MERTGKRDIRCSHLIILLSLLALIGSVMLGCDASPNQVVRPNGTATPVSSPALVVGADALYLLDAMTGKELWKQSSDGGFGQPVVVHGVIYDFCGDTICALDVHTGAMLWHVPFPLPTAMKGSMTSALTVVDDTIYGGWGADKYATRAGGLYALDAHNGAVRWRFQTGDSVITRPVVAQGAVYFGSSEHASSLGTGLGYLYAVRAQDGTLLWKRPAGSCVLSGEITVVGDMMYYPGGCDWRLHALRLTDQKEVWSFTDGSQRLPSYVPQDATLYVTGTLDGVHPTIFALRASDGTVRWQHTATDQGLVVTAAGDSVYAGTINDAQQPQGSENAENNVYAFQASDGAFHWKHAVFGRVTRVALIVGNLYVSTVSCTSPCLYNSSTGHLYAFNATTGTLRWQKLGFGFGLYNEPVPVS